MQLADTPSPQSATLGLHPVRIVLAKRFDKFIARYGDTPSYYVVRLACLVKRYS